MKYCLVINPQARNGRSRSKLDELKRELGKHHLRYECAFCESLEQARELSRAANLAGFDVVAGVGGDGTLNRVLNGFYDAAGKRVSPARFGAIHIGTSPDFCRSYGVPTALPQAVAALAANDTSRISVGRLIYEAGEETSRSAGGPGSALFGCCANIGLGASLARLANGGIRKGLGDVLGTLVCLLRVLRSYRPNEVELELDGQRQHVPEAYNVAVGKTRYLASGLKVQHELSVGDDRFYVITLRSVSWRNLVTLLRRLYAGRPIRSDSSVTFQYARTIRLRPVNHATEIEFDGDPAGQGPCRIETAPDGLDLIVGENL